MQKLEKQKHSHKFTNILKGIIFAIVMLAPFLAVSVRCLYVTNNDNAKDSYSASSIYETHEENIIDEIKTGYVVKYYSYNYSTLFDTTQVMEIDNIKPVYSNNSNFYNFLVTNQTLIKKLAFMNNGTSNPYLSFRKDDNSTLDNWTLVNTTLEFTFNVTVDVQIDSQKETLLTYIVPNSENALDNAFEYSIDQLNEMPIFNWVKNTGIYTPISNMTNGLGFDNNNNPLALLLAYWSLNTAIYIVFDIIIWCFTKLTHFMIDTD